MLKGCLYSLSLLIVLIGTIYYIYEKHQDAINEYAEKNLQAFYEQSVEPLFKDFSDDYSDSVKVFLNEKFEQLKKEDYKLGEEKLDDLKKLLSEFSRKQVIDSVDFGNLKKIFE